MSTITDEPTTTPEPTVDKVGPGSLWKREETLELPDGRMGLIRLPNQFQHADIRQAALAAKARRIRQLRDPESDACVVLEAEMDDIFRSGAKDILIDELTAREWWREHLQAMEDIAEEEQFEHIERDRARLEELRAMDPLERDKDEYGELDRHVTAYNAAVEERATELKRPRREALEALDISDLVDQIREARITAEGDATFGLHFSLWQIYSGSFELASIETRRVHGRETEVPVPGPKLFQVIDDVRTADPNLLDALTHAFAELETSYAEALQGNS